MTKENVFYFSHGTNWRNCPDWINNRVSREEMDVDNQGHFISVYRQSVRFGKLRDIAYPGDWILRYTDGTIKIVRDADYRGSGTKYD